MNSQLIAAANLQTFHKDTGLPPAEYVKQEMVTRGGGFDAISLREQQLRIITATSIKGLALVTLLRQFNKDDATQHGFVVIAFDLTGAVLYHSGHDGRKLAKSKKTGYREYGEVCAELADDPSLLAAALKRELDKTMQRAEYLTQLLHDVPAVANDTGEDDEPGEATSHAPYNPAEAVTDPDTGTHAAMSTSSRRQAQGSRRK
jgi:hypothetical protein